MDFDVTKMFHCAHVIWPIILTEGLECGLIAHVVDLGLYTVVYWRFNYGCITAMRDLHIKGSDSLITQPWGIYYWWTRTLPVVLCPSLAPLCSLLYSCLFIYIQSNPEVWISKSTSVLLLKGMIRYRVVCFCHTHEWNLLEYNSRVIKERSMFFPLWFSWGNLLSTINPSNLESSCN